MPPTLELCMRDTPSEQGKKTAETSVLRAWFGASWCSSLSQLLLPLCRESGQLLALKWSATW